MPRFAVVYRYAPELAAARDENRPAHREWLAARVAAGEVLAVGPFADGSGALLVVDAADAAAARELVARDPHAVRGLLAGTDVREWTPVFGALA